MSFIYVCNIVILVIKMVLEGNSVVEFPYIVPEF